MEEHEESKAQPALPHFSSEQTGEGSFQPCRQSWMWQWGQEGDRGQQSTMGASWPSGLSAASGFLWDPAG